MEIEKLTYIDLFAGCGGLSLGLVNAGWKGLFAIEKSEHAFKTLEHNLIHKKNHFDWPNWLPKRNFDISHIIDVYNDEIATLKGRIDMVVGGPPCQGFSTAGKRDESDKRNQLVNSYIKFIEIIRPRLIFFENVRGFTCAFKSLGSEGKIYSNYVIEKLSSLGYNVQSEVIDFSNFGIPQRRKRFILVGSLDGGIENFFPRLNDQKKRFLKGKGLPPKTTLKDAISDLLRKHGEADSPDTKHFKAGIYSKANSKYQKLLRNGTKYKGKIADSHRFARHKNETIEKFDYIVRNAPRNKELGFLLKDKFQISKRSVVLLDENSISPTLTTLPDDCIHYSEPRILTVREYARIQSFPDWYEFIGCYTTGNKQRKITCPRYTQVGNAVPPLFAEAIGLSLKNLANKKINNNL